MQHLEHNNILYSKQHGFRRNHSRETQLLLTIEDLGKNLDEGYEVDLQIFDFSKAFDKVPHQRLLSKLNYYGIQGKTLVWINFWLTERIQRVVVDGEASSFVKVTSGVPQGTVLGPLMFLLFINGIHENLDSTLRQEIIKVRERIPHIGPLTKVIPLKLFLDMEPSSSEDATRAMRGQASDFLETT